MSISGEQDAHITVKHTNNRPVINVIFIEKFIGFISITKLHQDPEDVIMNNSAAISIIT
jgi:hypothetical protein